MKSTTAGSGMTWAITWRLSAVSAASRCPAEKARMAQTEAPVRDKIKEKFQE